MLMFLICFMPCFGGFRSFVGRKVGKPIADEVLNQMAQDPEALLNLAKRLTEEMKTIANQTVLKNAEQVKEILKEHTSKIDQKIQEGITAGIERFTGATAKE